MRATIDSSSESTSLYNKAKLELEFRALQSPKKTNRNLWILGPLLIAFIVAFLFFVCGVRPESIQLGIFSYPMSTLHGIFEAEAPVQTARE